MSTLHPSFAMISDDYEDTLPLSYLMQPLQPVPRAVQVGVYFDFLIRAAEQMQAMEAAEAAGDPGFGDYDLPTITVTGKTRVVHMHTHAELIDVYIGSKKTHNGAVWEASRWANPYQKKCNGGTSDVAVELYRRYIEQRPDLLADLHTLKNKVLGCWCSPFSKCHGDVLVELANAS